jgi:ABC-type cobalamin/Fe3+-siderophores transport system ATPase subunit
MLKAVNVCFNYEDNFPAITDLSCEVWENDFIGILGPNGSGKTTLLKLLSGLLAPRQGELLLNGRKIKALSEKELARSRAYVPQQSDMEIDHTVEEVVWFGRAPYTDFLGRTKGTAQVEQAIADCSLQELRKRSILSISGGELQRVVLARALAQDTQIIFLDEPTHYLDIYYQLRFLETLKKLNKQGRTIIAVFHDLTMAARFCNKFIMLKKGRNVVSGNFTEVFSAENIEDIYRVKVKINKQKRSLEYLQVK